MSEEQQVSRCLVHEFNVFTIFMFIILGKMSTRVVLVPAMLPMDNELVAQENLQ